MKKEKISILLLNDDDKKRLTKSCEKVIDFISNETKSIEEKAFILKILIESFEKTQNCVIPFENR